jgi:hypothetical protein
MNRVARSVDLMAEPTKPTKALLEIRRKGEADHALSKAEWTVLAHFVQQGLEAFPADTPNPVSRESLIAVLRCVPPRIRTAKGIGLVSRVRQRACGNARCACGNATISLLSRPPQQPCLLSRALPAIPAAWHRARAPALQSTDCRPRSVLPR